MHDDADARQGSMAEHANQRAIMKLEISIYIGFCAIFFIPTVSTLDAIFHSFHLLALFIFRTMSMLLSRTAHEYTHLAHK